MSSHHMGTMPSPQMHHPDHTLHILVFGTALIVAAVIGIRENNKAKRRRAENSKEQ